MRDINFCSDKLIEFWKVLRPAFEAKFPGWKIVLDETFRPAGEQFALFCKGRRVDTKIDSKTGKRTIVSSIVLDEGQILTKIDGITRRGAHNFDPSLAFDVAIKNPLGHNNYVYHLPQWQELGSYLVPGVSWGGHFGKRDAEGKLLPGSFVDYPHFEDTDFETKFNGGK